MRDLLRRWRGRRRDERAAAIADLRARDVVGCLALTGDGAWDDRLQRTLILPAGRHLLVVDAAAPAASRETAALLLEGTPAPGTLALLEKDDSVHVWDLTDLLRRAEQGDERAGANLYELELHVGQRALEAADALFPQRDDLR